MPLEHLDAVVMRRFTFKVQMAALDDDGKVKFFKRYFKSELSADERRRLLSIPNLTPGDFRTVRERLYFLAGKKERRRQCAPLRGARGRVSGEEGFPRHHWLCALRCQRHPGGRRKAATSRRCRDESEPEKYTLTISDHARPIKDSRIRLSFVPENVLMVGMTSYDYNGSRIRIYDKERLLIDTARMKGRMPPDLYKEVINHYRQIKDELDGSKFPEYLEPFPHRDRIMQVIDTEVF